MWVKVIGLRNMTSFQAIYHVISRIIEHRLLDSDPRSGLITFYMFYSYGSGVGCLDDPFSFVLSPIQSISIQILFISRLGREKSRNMERFPEVPNNWSALEQKDPKIL